LEDLMNRALLVIAGLVAAAGVFYLSRTEYPPKNEQVQGALGGRRLAHGATVCVNGIQNLSEQKPNLEGIDDDLVGQLNKVGYRARLLSGQGKHDAPGAAGTCEATVFGEIVNLKGKDKAEAEVEFRLMIAGDQTPFLSSMAKGKGTDPVAENMILSAAPGKKPGVTRRDPAVVQREAIVAAFADAARQIEEQRPSRPTRASN
jgi:hypothetical protein